METVWRFCIYKKLQIEQLKSLSIQNHAQKGRWRIGCLPGMLGYADE